MRTINECGCEDEPHSVHGESMHTVGFKPDILRQHVDSQAGDSNVQCPETYQKVADHVCNDPYAILNALKPIMQKIGVGCPQSFAKALADVFEVGQDMGIVKPFNTEDI